MLSARCKKKNKRLNELDEQELTSKVGSEPRTIDSSNLCAYFEVNQ